MSSALGVNEFSTSTIHAAFSLGVTWAASEHFELSASYVKVDLADTPEVDILSSSGARLEGEFDGGANLFGVSAQYKF